MNKFIKPAPGVYSSILSVAVGEYLILGGVALRGLSDCNSNGVSTRAMSNHR